MEIKYVVFPGFITSQTDGQHHYIGAMKRMQLYGVNPKECTIYEPSPDWGPSSFRYAQERIAGKIKLRPRRDGDYTLPLA